MCTFISFYSPTFHLLNTHTLPHYHVGALSSSSPRTHQTRGKRIDHTNPGNLYVFQTGKKKGTNMVISIAGCFIVTMPKCFPMLPPWRIYLPFHSGHTHRHTHSIELLSLHLKWRDFHWGHVWSDPMRLDQAQSVGHVWVLCTHTRTDIHSSLYSNHSQPWLSDLPCCSP